MAVRCPSCGAKAPRGAHFCPDCGIRVDPRRSPPETAPVVTIETHEPLESGESSDPLVTIAKWLGTAFGIFVFVVMTCAFYALVVVVYQAVDSSAGPLPSLGLATILYLLVLALAFAVLRRTVFAEQTRVIRLRARPGAHALDTDPDIVSPEAADDRAPQEEHAPSPLMRALTFPFRVIGWSLLALVVVIVVCALFAVSVIVVGSFGGPLPVGLAGGAVVVGLVGFAIYRFFDSIGATR